MKKLLIGILIMLAMVVSVQAAPYLMVDAHKVVCDRNTESDMAGYHIYWRAVATPATPWVDAQRSPLIPQPPAGQLGCQFDLLNFTLPNGSYEITATAKDISGNESGPSNIVPFVVDLPAAPGTLRKQ